MTVQLELWQLITLLVAFFGAVGAAGKILLDQIEKRLAVKFGAIEEARREGAKVWEQQFAALRTQANQEAAEWRRLERDFLAFQAKLPERFVMREDYIRGQSIIEAKQDALAGWQAATSKTLDQLVGRIDALFKGAQQ